MACAACQALASKKPLSLIWKFPWAEALGRPQGLALVGTFARQKLERFQPAREQFVAQQHFDVGRRTGPATGGENFLQRGHGVKAGAVQQIDRRELFLPSRRLGLVGAPVQRVRQRVCEGGLQYATARGLKR